MAETDATDKPVEEAASNAGLGTSFASGVKWSSASQFGRQLVQFATTAVLARLLQPSDFGLVGMATVVTNFVMTFKDLGTAAAVVQRKKLSEELLSSMFWVNLAFGLLATLAIFLLAPAGAAFYHEPRVTSLVRVLSVSFLVSGITNVQQALLQREMAFDKLAKVEIAASLAACVVGISSALMGCGAWSLVYQALTLAGVTTTLLWILAEWRPKMVFSWGEVSSVSGFSLSLAGFGIVNYFSRNADYLLIGRFLGAESLGFYTLAYRLMLYPLQSISSVIGRVLLPVYSKIQDDDERFRAAFLRVAGAIAMTVMPVMAGLMALAHPFMLACFGPKWEPVAMLLVILAPVGLIQSIGTMNGNIYTAKGRTGLQFAVGTLFAAITTAAFAVGLRWGIRGVALSYAAASILLTYPSFAVCFRLIGLRVFQLIPAVGKPFLASMVMGTALFGLRQAAPSLDPRLSMLAFVPAGIGLYLLIMLMIGREDLLGTFGRLKR